MLVYNLFTTCSEKHVIFEMILFESIV